MDKLQQKIDEVLAEAGYGLEKQAFNPFTGPGMTRPGLRPTNSNTADLDLLRVGQGKNEDLQDYEGVEGRGGKSLELTQVFNDNAIKKVVASPCDLRARFRNTLRKQANKASGITHDIQATTAFTGSDALDSVKLAGMLDAIMRRLPINKALPMMGELRGMAGGISEGLGKAVGGIDDYLRVKALENAVASGDDLALKGLYEQLGGIARVNADDLARMQAESAAYTQFMQSPPPNPLPGLGLAAGLGAVGGGATVHRMHEPYIRQLRPREDQQ